MNEALKEQIGGHHYKDMPVQPTEFIYRNNLPFIEGCIIKYVCRHRTKDGKKDLEKAIHYLKLLIGFEYSRREKK
jgi:hypothetical protein